MVENMYQFEEITTEILGQTNYVNLVLNNQDTQFNWASHDISNPTFTNVTQVNDWENVVVDLPSSSHINEQPMHVPTDTLSYHNFDATMVIIIYIV